jgi:UDP-N-acetylglucosamine 2-epimerase (non-hydrolysing)
MTRPKRLANAAVVIGTRPEAIKLMPVVRSLEEAGVEVRVFSTGQHRELLDPLLEELGISPTENLDVMGEDQSLAELSARVLKGIDGLLRCQRPELLVVQGDTTSAAMSALTAFYRDVPVAHVEAGLRSLVGCLADWHFAPTPRARKNLLEAGISDNRIHVVGNTVIDTLTWVRDEVVPGLERDPELDELGRPHRALVLVTSHRRESFGPDLAATCAGLARLARAFPEEIDLVFPVHLNPSVRAQVYPTLSGIGNLHLLEPLSYLRFVRLMLRAKLIITDSGGIQEEATFLGIPTLVTRRTSERPEAIEAGVAERTDASSDRLFEVARTLLTDEAGWRARAVPSSVFGDGTAARKIVEILLGDNA